MPLRISHIWLIEIFVLSSSIDIRNNHSILECFNNAHHSFHQASINLKLAPSCSFDFDIQDDMKSPLKGEFSKLCIDLFSIID